MRIDRFTFGSIRIDGEIYAHDVLIDRGRVRKRKKKRSKPFRDAFGHTPLSVEETFHGSAAASAEGALPGDGPGEAGGGTSQGGAADASDPRSDPRAAGRVEGHERDPPRDLLMLRLLRVGVFGASAVESEELDAFGWCDGRASPAGNP
jgi:hypothetical protein